MFCEPVSIAVRIYCSLAGAKVEVPCSMPVVTRAVEPEQGRAAAQVDRDFAFAIGITATTDRPSAILHVKPFAIDLCFVEDRIFARRLLLAAHMAIRRSTPEVGGLADPRTRPVVGRLQVGAMVGLQCRKVVCRALNAERRFVGDGHLRWGPLWRNPPAMVSLSATLAPVNRRQAPSRCSHSCLVG